MRCKTCYNGNTPYSSNGECPVSECSAIKKCITTLKLIVIGAKCAGPGKCKWCRSYNALQVKDGVEKTGDLCQSTCLADYVYRNPAMKYECVKCLSLRCKLKYTKFFNDHTDLC